MDKFKRVLTIISIATLVGAVCILIAAIFSIVSLTGIVLSILFTLGILCTGSVLMINAVSIYKKRKKLSTITLVLLAISICLAIISVWMNYESSSVFSKISFIFALASVLFAVIVSNYIKLGKTHKFLQILTYIFIIILDLIFTAMILGLDLSSLTWLPKVLTVICLVVFILLVTLTILSKKSLKENGDANKPQLAEDCIQVEKAVYDALVEKVNKLEEENKLLKSLLQK